MGKAMRTLSPLSHCAKVCGLSAKEMIVGVEPRPEHLRLASRYDQCSLENKRLMRIAMVAAIRAALARAAYLPAAELFTALRLMLGGERRRCNGALRRSRRSLYQSRCAVREASRVEQPADREGRLYDLAEWRKRV
jgi:hypothetical protein